MATNRELKADLDDLRDDLEYELRVVNSRLRRIETMLRKLSEGD